MKKTAKKELFLGIGLVAAFLVWTLLVLVVDVKPLGQEGTDIGFATINNWFHDLTGVHMAIYDATDLLSVVPFLVCIGFGGLGVYQLFTRKSLKKVDLDIILLGIYFVAVILGYALFEVVHINYRPILIEGKLEPSYPSSTTLLVLSVMPTLAFQADRRCKQPGIRLAVKVAVILFTAYMVLGRMFCGVHWLTDIIGGVLLSAGLYLIYRGSVHLFCKKKARRGKKHKKA